MIYNGGRQTRYEDHEESLNTEAYEIFGSGRALFVMGRFIDC